MPVPVVGLLFYCKISDIFERSAESAASAGAAALEGRIRQGNAAVVGAVGWRCCPRPTMNHVVAAFLTSSVTSMMEESRRKEKGPITLREVARRVQLANRVTTKWQLILAEGCGLHALARDELVNVLETILCQPFETVALAVTMRAAPRHNGMYPGRSPGFLAALRSFASAHSFWGLFSGWVPMYLTYLIQSSRPSYVLPGELAEEPVGYDFDADWTRVHTSAMREIMRWLCFTASHPFHVVASRMMYYGGAEYSSMWVAFRTIVQNEGVAGLFKGHSLTLVMSLVAMVFGEQYVPILEMFPPLTLLQTRLMLDTGAVKSPFTAAAEVFHEGGFAGFFAGSAALMWSLPLYMLPAAGAEAVALLLFGFKQHKSPRTVPQRARTALRRWFFGESEADRRARVEQFRQKHGAVTEVLGKSSGDESK